MSSISAGTTSTTTLVHSGDTTGSLVFKTNDTGSGGTTAVTIDTSQNVGIGGTPAQKLDVIGSGSRTRWNVNNSYVYQVISNPADSAYAENRVDALQHTWYVSNSERMRIDSSGNLLVGTTTASLTSGEGFKFFYNGGTNPYVGATMSSSSNSQTNYHLYSTGAGAYRFYVGLAGTVYATSTTITGISDQRLKENIRDLDDGLNAVLALKPRKFDWKEGKGADIKNARGFIAQEFETVFPDMIEQWLDPAPEGEEPYKAVNANLIPTLVKAIQELKAINDQQAETINALTARVVALESK